MNRGSTLPPTRVPPLNVAGQRRHGILRAGTLSRPRLHKQAHGALTGGSGSRGTGARVHGGGSQPLGAGGLDGV